MKNRLNITQLDHTATIADSALFAEYWNDISKHQVLEITVAALSGQRKQALKALEKVMLRLYMSTAPKHLKQRLASPADLKKHQHNARLRIRRLVDSYLKEAVLSGLSVVVDDTEYTAKSKQQLRLKVEAVANQNGGEIKSIRFVKVVPVQPGDGGTKSKAKQQGEGSKAKGKGNHTTKTEDKDKAKVDEYQQGLALAQSPEAFETWAKGLNASNRRAFTGYLNIMLSIDKEHREAAKARAAKARKANRAKAKQQQTGASK